MSKSFNFFAISAGVTLLVFLVGALYALITQGLTFTEFGAAVGIPLSAMTGWAAKSASVPLAEKLLS